jgi:hypothetical protein
MFERPPTVWSIEGTTLARATADALEREPAASPAPELIDLLIDAELELVAEGGVVCGEVAGLEVARINANGLEVGVGQADRELTKLLLGDLAPVDQLARVVELVRRYRRADAPLHPLNQLVPERWLRSQLVDDPRRIGLERLTPAPAAIPRANLRESGVAMAHGVAPNGSTVVVGCSVGVDLDAVPSAADSHALIEPGARLLVAVPERDVHPVTAALAARLVEPAEVVPVRGDWRL